MAEENRFVPVKDVLDILFAEFHSFWEVPCSNYDRAIQRRICAVRDKINQLEPVDTRAVALGKWVCIPQAEGLPRYQCNQCGHYVDAGNDRNYCSNCGARMVNVQDRVYKAPLEKVVDIESYNELREAFVDYACSGMSNLAPYCKNRCEACVDGRGWCRESFCKGFNP